MDSKVNFFVVTKKLRKNILDFINDLILKGLMINKFLKRYGLLILFFIVFSIVGVSSFNYVQSPTKKLPIYSPSMVSDELYEEDLRYVKKYHRINDFSLYNQNGNQVTQDNYTYTPLISSIESTIANPSNCVEGIAYKGWIRGGMPSRLLNREVDKKINTTM